MGMLRLDHVGVAVDDLDAVAGHPAIGSADPLACGWLIVVGAVNVVVQPASGGWLVVALGVIARLAARNQAARGAVAGAGAQSTKEASHA